jgi:hypothetical protein
MDLGGSRGDFTLYANLSVVGATIRIMEKDCLCSPQYVSGRWDN